MPSTFIEVDRNTPHGAEAFSIMEDLMQSVQLHRPLEQCEVRIGLMWAIGDGDKPALKLRGHRALAIARIIPYRDRAKGMPDAMIYLDFDWWKVATDRQRRSHIDHELTHFEAKVQLDDDGNVFRDDDGKPDVKRDPADRPKLKMRPHDIEVGVFIRCIEEHQHDAVDFAAVNVLASATKAAMKQQVLWG